MNAHPRRTKCRSYLPTYLRSAKVVVVGGQYGCIDGVITVVRVACQRSKEKDLVLGDVGGEANDMGVEDRDLRLGCV